MICRLYQSWSGGIFGPVDSSPPFLRLQFFQRHHPMIPWMPVFENSMLEVPTTPPFSTPPKLSLLSLHTVTQPGGLHSHYNFSESTHPRSSHLERIRFLVPGIHLRNILALKDAKNWSMGAKFDMLYLRTPQIYEFKVNMMVVLRPVHRVCMDV